MTKKKENVAKEPKVTVKKKAATGRNKDFEKSLEEEQLKRSLQETNRKDRKNKEDPEEIKRIEYMHRFYTYRFDKHGELVVSPDNLSIIEVLREMGYYRYDQPEGVSEYVRIKDNKIRLIKNTQEIIDAFEDYLRVIPARKIDIPPIWLELYDQEEYLEIDGDRLLRQFYKNIMYYFSSTLPRLRPINGEEITILHDTKNVKYFFFNNCIVAVSVKGTQVIPYKDMKKEITALNDFFGETNGQYIWESNILNRDYHKTDSVGDFEIFCQYICGIEGCSISKENGLQYINRFTSLQSIFGYLLHDNYEANLKSVLFIDVNKSNSGKPAGGTGKGIIGKALSLMINRTQNDCKYVAVGGKGFDPQDERRYSSGDITTQLVHIEDIAKNFDFTNFFNDVTDGAPFRKMYQDKTTHRIKTMLSSNIPIDLSAPSCKRRLVVFELDNYFDANRTPVDVFGRRFFESDWNEKDWYAFDKFMIGCSQEYMMYKDKRDDNGKIIGIKEPPLINYKQQLLNSKLTKDFIEWFGNKISDAVANKTTLILVKPDLVKEWQDRYTEYEHLTLFARTFTGWCKFYLETMEIPSGEKRSTQDLLIIYPDVKDPKVDFIIRL